jgi:hypothetical protein
MAVNTMRREIPILFCIILLAFSMIVPAFAAKTMPIEVETHREFVSPYTGEVERHASFYAFTGEHIQWWAGGAVFIYNVNGTEAKGQDTKLHPKPSKAPKGHRIHHRSRNG